MKRDGTFVQYQIFIYNLYFLACFNTQFCFFAITLPQCCIGAGGEGDERAPLKKIQYLVLRLLGKSGTFLRCFQKVAVLSALGFQYTVYHETAQVFLL